MERDVCRPQENSEKTNTVSLQPLVADHATIPHMKAMNFPFHIRYSSLIWYMKLQSDRLYCTVLGMGRNRGASASRPTNWLFLRVWMADIPHLKEGTQGYLLILKSGL